VFLNPFGKLLNKKQQIKVTSPYEFHSTMNLETLPCNPVPERQIKFPGWQMAPNPAASAKEGFSQVTTYES
jgi:hypothetical protein